MSAFRAARLSESLDALRGLDSTDAAHLRARTWLRAGDASAALNALPAPTHYEGLQSSLHAEAETLRGVAFARLGDDRLADESMSEALVRAISSASPAHEAEAFFYRGLAAFDREEFDAAERDARHAADVVESLGSRTVAHVMPLTVGNARGSELIGLTFAARGRYHEQLPHAIRAYELAHAGEDRWIEAFALLNLIVLARDLDRDPRIATIVSELQTRALSFPWSPDLARKRFQAFDSFATIAALRGDNLGAMRWHRRASTVAQVPEEVVQSALGRAFLASRFGQHLSALEDIDFALDVARGINWSRAIGDRHLVLLEIAHIAAEIAPDQASAALERYRGLRIMESGSASRFELRPRALEHTAAGAVARAKGDIATARREFSNAYEIWNAIGIEWRATEAAQELLLSGDLRFAECARRGALERPGSWLERRLVA